MTNLTSSTSEIKSWHQIWIFVEFQRQGQTWVKKVVVCRKDCETSRVEYEQNIKRYIAVNYNVQYVHREANNSKYRVAPLFVLTINKKVLDIKNSIKKQFLV